LIETCREFFFAKIMNFQLRLSDFVGCYTNKVLWAIAKRLLFYRFKLRMQGIQVDNQLPLAPMPVLFRPQRTGDKADYILKFSVTLQSNAGLDLRVYPYIDFQVSLYSFCFRPEQLFLAFKILLTLLYLFTRDVKILPF